jgi:hypothetical protein
MVSWVIYELPEPVFQWVQDCNDLDVISTGDMEP